MIDDKGRYQWSSSATKKLALSINFPSPTKPIGEMTNDEKVIGEPTPIKSVVDSRITFLNRSASQSLQTEAQEMPQSKSNTFD